MKRSSTAQQRRVIVLGAGMSGLACANELQERGYEVLVVEARSRCGGRCKGDTLTTSSANGNNDMANIDLGGALIHGIDDNPVYELCNELGVQCHPVETTLLLDDSGWPVDHKVDERVSNQFNECLDASFALAASNSQSKESFGSLLDRVCEQHSVPKSALFQWHQANLELSCGAGFDRLGYQWNDDEPYGFDGAHVALQTSWKTVMEAMASNVNILYDSPVTHVHTVYAPKNNSNSSSTKPTKKPPVKVAAAVPPRKLSKPAAAPLFESPAPIPSRQSRRLRGQDASARRSSSRANKAVDRFVADPSSPYKRTTTKTKQKQGTTDKVKSVGPKQTLVQVTLQNGTVLEAPHVVCTLPLAILQSNRVTFDPPLSPSHQDAISNLGTGLLNKCVLAFDHVFWQDVDFFGHAAATAAAADDEDSQNDHHHSYLILNAASYTGQPILIFMYGGNFARDMEAWTDQEVVSDCLRVLGKIYSANKTPVPQPIDYIVTRWGQDVHAGMAFTYIPPGVNGFEQLQAMSQPIVDTVKDKDDNDVAIPVLQFAGEHTTPYHPSTIHGAYLSGIREAYRLDCILEPNANEGLVFSGQQLYQRTFSLQRKVRGGATAERKMPAAAARATSATVSTTRPTGTRRRRGAAGVMALRRRPKTLLPVPQQQQQKQQREQALTDTAMPTRKSKRSAAVAPKNGTVTTDFSPQNSNDGVLPSSSAVDLDALENRVLLRGVETYGGNYEYIRTTLLPIHGSTRQRSLAQVRQHVLQLLRQQQQKNKNKKRSANGNTLSRSVRKFWVATVIYPSANRPSQSQRTAKRRLSDDASGAAGNGSITHHASKPATSTRTGLGRTVRPRRVSEAAGNGAAPHGAVAAQATTRTRSGRLVRSPCVSEAAGNGAAPHGAVAAQATTRTRSGRIVRPRHVVPNA